MSCTKKKALKENKLTQPKTKGYLLRSYDIWNFQHTSGKSQVSDSVGLLSLLFVVVVLFFVLGGGGSCLTTAQKRFSITDNLTAIYTTGVICFLHCLVWRHSERKNIIHAQKFKRHCKRQKSELQSEAQRKKN